MFSGISGIFSQHPLQLRDLITDRRAILLITRTYFLLQAQDSTVGRIELLNLLTKKRDQGILSVGDSMQAINGWTGALPDAMAEFRAAPNTNSSSSSSDGSVGGSYHDLPCTWRCPKGHVRIVTQLLKRFDTEYTFNASPKAEEGLYVEGGTFTGEFALDPAGDQAVLCRWNKPLFELRLALMGRGVPCWIVGHEDIASQMSRALQTLTGSAAVPITALIGMIEAKLKELLEAIAGHDEDDDGDDDRRDPGGGGRHRDGSGVGGNGIVSTKEALKNEKDNLDCLRASAQHAKQHDRAATSDAVRESIQALRDHSVKAADDGKPNTIRLSTFHRAKGAGFHRVYLLAYDDHIQHIEDAIASNCKKWAVRQEIACAYVALTRSYSDLIILRNVGKGECPLLFEEYLTNTAGGGGRRRACVGPQWSAKATEAARQLDVQLANPSTVAQLVDPESRARVQAKLGRAVKDAFNAAVRNSHPDKQRGDGGSCSGGSGGAVAGGSTGGGGGGVGSTVCDARKLREMRDLILNEIETLLGG